MTKTKVKNLLIDVCCALIAVALLFVGTVYICGVQYNKTFRWETSAHALRYLDDFDITAKGLPEYCYAVRYTPAFGFFGAVKPSTKYCAGLEVYKNFHPDFHPQYADSYEGVVSHKYYRKIEGTKVVAYYYRIRFCIYNNQVYALFDDDTIGKSTIIRVQNDPLPSEAELDVYKRGFNSARLKNTTIVEQISATLGVIQYKGEEHLALVATEMHRQ